LPEVPTWHAPTLVLHGEKDFLVSVQQANLLRDSLEAARKPYQLVLYPNNGHHLPPEDVRKKAVAFLKETSGSACRAKVVNSLGFPSTNQPTGILSESSFGQQSGSN